MLSRFLTPDYYVPVLLSALLMFGKDGIAWFIRTTDMVKELKEVQAKQATMDYKVSAMSDRLERLLGLIEAQSRFSTHTPRTPRRTRDPITGDRE